MQRNVFLFVFHIVAVLRGCSSSLMWGSIVCGALFGAPAEARGQPPQLPPATAVEPSESAEPTIPPTHQTQSPEPSPAPQQPPLPSLVPEPTPTIAAPDQDSPVDAPAASYVGSDHRFDAPATMPPPTHARRVVVPSPAPAHPLRPLTPVSHDGSAALATSSSRPRERIEHRGFVLDAKVGTLGCTQVICGSGQRHDAAPGVFVGGFLGGNIAGFFEIGVDGGWGTLAASVRPGENALALYGIDPVALGERIAEQNGIPFAIDLSSLAVRDTQLRVARVGPTFRLHFVPRGRVAAFVGSGAAYELFRGRYQTDAGPLRIDFHGVGVPVQGGLHVYVNRHVALGVDFDYRFTWYGLVSLTHPEQRAMAPVAGVQAAAEVDDFAGQLPDFWTLTAALRTRF